MNRTHRLTGIVLALRGGRRTVQDLADRFEVSRRTILRDVSALCEIGVPLITTSGVGGGVEIGDGYWLPPLHLTPDEATVLLLGLQVIGGGDQAPLVAERRSAEEKLRAVLRPDITGVVERTLGSIAAAPPARPIRPDIFDTLRSAIERGGWIVATYHSARRVAEHTLFPVRMDLEEGRWYCDAILNDGERRRYRLDRFVEATPCPAPARTDAVATALAGPPARYDDPSYAEVVVRLTYAGMRRAGNEAGWVDHMTDGGNGTWELRYRCPPSEYPFYAREVIALGVEATALAPAAFVSMVRDGIAGIAAHYGMAPASSDAVVSRRGAR